MPFQAKPDEWLFIQKQRIADETLILGTGRYKDRLVGSEFINCVFDIVNPLAVLISRCRLINCMFRPRKEVNISIGDNYWEGCTFHGHFRSTHFGLSSDDIDGPSNWPEIALRFCDFSQATLQACCFRRLDVKSTIFPPWPSFSVLRPYENLKAWMAADLPFKQRLFNYSVSHEDNLDAIMYHWPSVAKKLAPPPDHEAVKVALQKLDFVRL